MGQITLMHPAIIGINSWNLLTQEVGVVDIQIVVGHLGTKITWGGPMVHFRWDNIDNMDIKNFSVREIQPTTTATTTTSMVNTSNAHTEFSPPSVIAVNPYH